ncbi:hypothetical protein Flexsi_1005 [Flexistipes sinusarabici DSM 4947]|uniref:Uncharacterized protein n=2 Tax=Flexistipes sinusarabici TaxID=2352 RepID=F8E5N3_FLESM|nr:hypothetical protein [Flexistipes sinusarabici]AEI14664.1 hypothetical protein Flexsi_1005 [Flexistipes sinusarabici DSM 4947]HCW94128.1 hypothetical protein [Flexistipes sinusarabici]
MIEDISKAKRFARTIITDIVLYNKSKVEEGIKSDNIFEILDEDIQMGRKLFEERVNTDVIDKKIFDKTLIDILIAKYGGKVDSDIW